MCLVLKTSFSHRGCIRKHSCRSRLSSSGVERVHLNNRCCNYFLCNIFKFFINKIPPKKEFGKLRRFSCCCIPLEYFLNIAQF
ncbi:hypothetical protein DKZ56_12560 [Ureibacillus thermophilus]|uniref:Uncharacterized protein n=1 Tax=Ureibacillus thermophilus TaxID=367743 RepID=A0A4P6UTW5_9BACL|nr:hypothetical protein DKZ56_12560 [Ureibacillus thermophilus]